VFLVEYETYKEIGGTVFVIIYELMRKTKMDISGE